MSRTEPSRPLRSTERDLLAKIVASMPSSIAPALTEQLRLTEAVDIGPRTFIDLVQVESPAPVACPDGPLPIEALVENDKGEFLGEILVWVTGGLLSALEYACVTDEAPSGFPVSSWVRTTFKQAR